MHYLAIAYRWGWTNAHHYHVALTQDEERCRKLAQEECEDRGGKYGVVVLEWASETEQKAVAYYPSAYGEDAPFKNERIDMFQGIGHDVHDVVTTLTHWAPPATPGEPSVPHAVAVPDWLVQFVRHREEHCRFMTALAEHHRSRTASNETREDTKAWVAATQMVVQAEVEALLAKAPEYQRAALTRFEAQKSETVAPTKVG